MLSFDDGKLAKYPPMDGPVGPDTSVEILYLAKLIYWESKFMGLKKFFEWDR